MAEKHTVFHQTISRALSGKDSHAGSASILEGLSWELAGALPEGVPHSVFQLANHIIYWQEWLVKWLDGKNPKAPKHAAGGWPGKVSPANRREWEQTMRRFRDVLDAVERRSQQEDLLSRRGKMTRLEMMHLVASHTSYHAGQVAFLRQQLAAWPPPSGGVTW
jgi:uncharacterized damage-inducible protein DinB